MNNNILVIAPHADDEILGCGATIAKHIDKGDNVYIAVMTNANVGAPELFSVDAIKLIRAEALAAHQLLGVKETFFFDYPAPRLETMPAYRISNSISAILNKYSIGILYIPFRGDAHKDHAVIFNASLVAARPINGCSVKEIYAYETLSETEWAAPFAEDNFVPNYFVEVSCYLENKLNAMTCFKSQLKQPPHPRSLEIIRALAILRGSTDGVCFAEAYF